MDERFQVVFNPEGVVEMLLLDMDIRKLTFDSADSPFSVGAMNDVEVRNALHAWMQDTNAQGWIGWRELEATLAGMGIDMKGVAARHPARP